MGRGDKFHFFISALVLFATVSWLSHGAWARDVQEVQRLCTVTTDAEKNLVCTLDVVVDRATGKATALKVDCGDPDPSHKIFTAEQLKSGVPLVHKDDKDVDVIQLSIADLDPVHGGTVKLHYLSSYLGKSYQDWFVEVHADGGNWILYTSPDNGHYPFNTLFAAKRTKLGITVGIKEFRASWVAGPTFAPSR